MNRLVLCTMQASFQTIVILAERTKLKTLQITKLPKKF